MTISFTGERAIYRLQNLSSSQMWWSLLLSMPLLLLLLVFLSIDWIQNSDTRRKLLLKSVCHALTFSKWIELFQLQMISSTLKHSISCHFCTIHSLSLSLYIQLLTNKRLNEKASKRKIVLMCNLFFRFLFSIFLLLAWCYSFPLDCSIINSNRCKSNFL